MSASIVENVYSFIDRAADLHGKSEAKKFAQSVQTDCVELGMSSPIEHMFWVACTAICSANYMTMNPEPYFDHKGNMRAGSGVYIQTQVKCGKYTVDFLISQDGIGPKSHLSPIVVELDGHQFHDKDKRQRS